MPSDVLTTLAGWSSTSNSNQPTGGTSVSSNLDDGIREIQGVVVRGLSHKGSDIASAATTDIGAVEGWSNSITGTTTITGLGTVRAGLVKTMIFSGVLTITHNATSLILKYGQNHLTTAGDVLTFQSLGSGNWKEISRNVAGGDVAPGMVMEYGGTTAPDGWLLGFGQAVSRTTYSALFAVYGTTHGVGDGSTTFNLPDYRGRSGVGRDDMGGAAANRITAGVSGITGTTLGAAGGNENPQQHSHGVTDPTHAHGVTHNAVTTTAAGGGGSSDGNPPSAASITVNAAATGISIQNSGTGTSGNVPPVIVMNKLIKT